MSESKLRELSTDFAVKVIKLCETIKGHYSLVNQLERSATSIGANIREETCRCTFCSRSGFVPEPSEPFSGQETHWQLLPKFGHRRPFSFAYFAPHNLSKP